MKVIFKFRQGGTYTMELPEQDGPKIIEGINFAKSKNGPFILSDKNEQTKEVNTRDITSIEFVY